MVRLRAATFFACLRRTTELSSKKDWSLSAPHEVGLKWADDEGYASQGWAQHSSSRYLRPSEYVIWSRHPRHPSVSPPTWEATGALKKAFRCVGESPGLHIFKTAGPSVDTTLTIYMQHAGRSILRRTAHQFGHRGAQRSNC
ncbi:uncharacterized protein LOC142813847 isoform X1 [Rhipicephalus microplus]|uniref:uncharacterized protein LOC142813847 isoform X1 n=1 Tax=Rhipicephalus microplus TaxID=6941 RepID=UPI003F6CD971